MRILLLTAPIPVQNSFFPIGLSYIYGALKKENYEVKIVDAIAPFKKYSKENIKELIKDYKPNVVGFSLFINFISDVYDFVKELKKLFRDVIFIAGGPHPSAMPEEAIRNGFDFVVVGEGEETIVELVKMIENSTNTFEKVKGIAFLDKYYNKIVITSPRPLIKDLDSLPFPERDLFPIENYTGFKDPNSDPYFWIISSSRGCPFDCLYCMNADVFGRGYRFRSAENVFQEIKELYTKFNARYIYFIDDEFMMKKERLYRLAALLVENNLNIGWTALARITNIDTEFINRMVSVGLKEIVFGVESGDLVTLEKINKRMTLEHIKQGIEYTIKSRIPTFGINNMIGFPWETRKNILNTYRLNKSIPDDIPVSHSFWIPIPYPRTGLYNRYHERYGFTNWWLDKKNFIPEYDEDNYQPFFKRHMFFLDHSQLRNNFYKYDLLHRLFIKKIFIKVWLLQAGRRFSHRKKYATFCLSFFSYTLYILSPKLEKFILSIILSSRVFQFFKRSFRIEKQTSIGHFVPRRNSEVLETLNLNET